MDYQKIKGAIPHSGLTELTKRVADRFGEYFKQFPEVQEITTDEFLLWYFGTVQTKADEETRSEWHAVMQRVAEPVADETKDTMFNRLIELQAASEIADIVMRYEEGRDVDVLAEIQESLKEAASNRKTSLETDIIEDDVLDMMDAEEAGVGFTFHTIPIINSYVKPVPPKNLIGIAARPDAGKTTLTGQVAFSFAKDLEKVLGLGRQVTWFCNEGDPRKIVYRMYSVALGMSVTEMRAFRETVCKGNNNLFLEKVWEAWGQEHIFKVINANNKTTSWVEDTVAKLNSGIIVYDMLDNVIFSGKTMHSGTRTDQVLESMYQWGRSLAVETNSVAIATSQTSGDAEGIPFPAKSQLKDSKCLAPDTPIRMFDGGIKLVQDVVVGDLVLGPDSTPRRVLATAEGEEQMYRVSGYGWDFGCNESHILTVQKATSKPMNGHAQGQVLDVPLRYFLKNPSRLAHYKAVQARVQYPEAVHLMEPYLLGLWLGDGHSKGCRITSADEEILVYLQGLSSYKHTYKQKGNAASDVYFGPNYVLRELGVFKNKHIPQEYKIASVEQRQRLLAGLMDSDGWIDHGTSVVSLANETLAQDVLEVARSLGYRAAIKKDKPNAWSVRFASTDLLPCRLKRKQHKCKARASSMQIEKIEGDKYYGFTVDEDSRYVLGNYIVTHNTGKQGTFDLLLMMGESSDPSMEKYRYLGTPKNKFARDDRPKNMQVTTIFDHTRGSFSAVGAAPKEVVDSSNRKVVKALEAQDDTVNTESQGDEPVAKPSRKSRKQAPIELKD